MDIISLVFPGLATLAGHLTPISPSNIAVMSAIYPTSYHHEHGQDTENVWLLLFVY